MNSSFTSGPFIFTPSSRELTINGLASRAWSVSYGHRHIAERTLHLEATKDQVREAFGDEIAAFSRSCQLPSPQLEKPDRALRVMLVTSTESTGEYGQVLGSFDMLADIPGLTPGMIDDRFETWLVTASPPQRSLPMGRAEFERLRTAHERIAETEQECKPPQKLPHPNAWIAELLPGDVLTENPSEWRAPNSWEIRHIVGEGSFTGISGEKAAKLVGVTPQNFRKYTASDAASTRQRMSFAMWHLLLHKLGVVSS